jgi:hypothetical protein
LESFLVNCAQRAKVVQYRVQYSCGCGESRVKKFRRAYRPTTALAKSMRFDAEMMHVSLTDGRIVSLPLHWFPLLNEATPQQREHYEIGGGGIGLYWPEIERTGNRHSSGAAFWFAMQTAARVTVRAPGVAVPVGGYENGGIGSAAWNAQGSGLGFFGIGRVRPLRTAAPLPGHFRKIVDPTRCAFSEYSRFSDCRG